MDICNLDFENVCVKNGVMLYNDKPLPEIFLYNIKFPFGVGFPQGACHNNGYKPIIQTKLNSNLHRSILSLDSIIKMPFFSLKAQLISFFYYKGLIKDIIITIFDFFNKNDIGYHSLLKQKHSYAPLIRTRLYSKTLNDSFSLCCKVFDKYGNIINFDFNNSKCDSYIFQNFYANLKVKFGKMWHFNLSPDNILVYGINMNITEIHLH